MITGNCSSNVTWVMSVTPERKSSPPQFILRSTIVSGSYSFSTLPSPDAGGNIANRSTVTRALGQRRGGQTWLELTERAFPERIRLRSLLGADQVSISRVNIRVRTV